jgi:hypothetical protein
MRRIVSLLAIVLLALSTVSIASAASSDVVRRGSCSAAGRWKWDLSDHGRRIEADFEVHRSPSADTWRVRLRHDGHLYFRNHKIADDSGEFSVDRFVKDRAGTDRFRGRAVDTSTGEVCRGAAHI